MTRRRRPKIVTGTRILLLARLVANGLLQTALAIGIAFLTARMLGFFSQPTALPVLGWTSAALVIAGLVTAALRTLQRRDAEALGLSYVRDLQFLVFARLCRAAPESVRIGSTMTRFTTDLSSVKNWISQGVASSLVAAAALSAGLVALVFLDWRLAVASILPFAICGIVAAAVSAPLMDSVRRSRRLRGRLSGRIGDNIMVRTTLMHLGLIERETRRLSERASELDAVLIRRALLAGALRFSVEAIAPCAAALVLIFHALDTGSTPLSAHTVASWLFALTIIIGPVRDCARAWDYRLAYSETINRLEKLLRRTPARRRGAAAKRDIPADGGIRLSGVKLDGRPQTLELEAPPGSLVAVTGEASGRSDLFETIAGLGRAEAGTIMLGDTQLSDMPARHFSRTVGLVSPAVPPLRGSLRKNLSRGAEPVEDEALLAVLRRCRLDLVFPEGLETRLRSGAGGLPAGIRARLALARALVRDPRLLLIDDPILMADREGRAVLSEIASARERITLVAMDEPQILDMPVDVWALPDNPRRKGAADTELEAALED